MQSCRLVQSVFLLLLSTSNLVLSLQACNSDTGFPRSNTIHSILHFYISYRDICVNVPRKDKKLYTSLLGTPPGRVCTFSWNSFSAPCHTGVDDRSLRAIRLGSRALLKASDDSRGSADGRWSMEMTESLGPLPSTETSTVGLSKVVLMS